jgi:hypothetical protein
MYKVWISTEGANEVYSTHDTKEEASITVEQILHKYSSVWIAIDTNVIYMLDRIENRDYRYKKHKELYSRCYEYQRYELGLIKNNPMVDVLEPTEAQIQEMEARFLEMYQGEDNKR